MKPTIKNLKTKFLYIILPVVLILILVIVLYQSNQRIKVLKSGIDLKPRPFSELLATDFADVKDEVADPSKCDGSKVIEQIKKSSTNPNLSDKWKDYDPNIHKLTILDDCWRQYENQYVKFKFRDLNGSLRMDTPNNLGINNSSYSFGVWLQKKPKGLVRSILDYVNSQIIKKFVSIKVFISPNNVVLYRLNDQYYSPLLVDEVVYIIDLPSENHYLYIWSKSNRIAKDILSTIEIKK